MTLNDFFVLEKLYWIYLFLCVYYLNLCFKNRFKILSYEGKFRRSFLRIGENLFMGFL